MTTMEHDYVTLDVDGDGQRIAPYAPPLIVLDVERANTVLARLGVPPLEVEPDGSVYLDSARTIQYEQVPQARRWGSWHQQVAVWKRVE